MAKSRKRKVSHEKASGQGLTAFTQPPNPLLRRAFTYGFLLLLVLGGLFLLYDAWRNDSREEAFLALAGDGRASLPEIEREQDFGRRHLDPGEGYDYNKKFPTSGPHKLTPTLPGFYDEPQPAIAVVHALEHGNIVIYIDQPGREVTSLLGEWVALYGGAWDGIVVVPEAGLGKRVVLTAWRRRLDLSSFDSALAAAFIDLYRGRGPEKAVR